MNNKIENSLRLYNVKNLRRTRMHSYTKKNVDNAVLSVLYREPRIEIFPLSNEDIAEYKKHFDERKFEEYISQTYNYEPLKKKIKLFDESEEKNPETLKLVLFREGETDKFTSQFKTVNNEKDNTSAISSCNTSSSSSSVTEGSENQLSNESPTNKIAVKSIIGSIRVKKDDFFFANKDDIERFRKMFRNQNSLNVTKPSKKITSTVPFNGVYNVFNVISPVTKVKIPLREIERLYQKYFSKNVQDTIVIIANILNMISLSNKHHKFRMDESFKKKSEAEKLKERCDANRMHLRHKKVLEAKLKANFLDVINKFMDSEFEPTFQMFFLSILTVLRVLEQPKFKKGSIFKNLVLLLWNSLKNCDFDSPKVFGLFRSKSFRPDCIDLISLIEDSRNSDPGITDRLALFFLSTVNSRESFQPVLTALTNDSNEDLAQLLDNAIRYCRLHSKFKDRVVNSLPIQESVIQTPATSVQNNVSVVEDNQQWLLAKAPNGSSQPLLAVQPANEQKTQKTTYVISDPSKPRMFYENFSNSLNQTPLLEPGTPKVIAPKVSVVTTAAVSSGSLGKPTLLIKQNFKPIPASTIQRSEFNTIFVGAKQYQLIRGPSGQIRAVAASSLSTSTTSNVVTSNVVFKQAAPPKPTADAAVRCFAKNCRSSATIMCSTCKSVKYCSNTCQRQDWYESHIHNCQRLKSMKQNHC